MPKLLDLLKEYPAFGFLSTTTAALQAFIETSTPVLQFLGLLIGVAIGIITLALKVREITRKERI